MAEQGDPSLVEEKSAALAFASLGSKAELGGICRKRSFPSCPEKVVEEGDVWFSAALVAADVVLAAAALFPSNLP